MIGKGEVRPGKGFASSLPEPSNMTAVEGSPRDSAETENLSRAALESGWVSL